MPTILVRGGITIIDDCDLDLFAQYPWYLSWNGYLIAQIKQGAKYIKTIRFHRIIMDAPNGMDVDHKNDVRHDNRRENLRICTRSDNLKRRRVSGKSTPYHGVSLYKSRGNYEACIRINGKRKRIGYFDTAIEAARAYDMVAINVYGEYARLNNV